MSEKSESERGSNTACICCTWFARSWHRRIARRQIRLMLTHLGAFVKYLEYCFVPSFVHSNDVAQKASKYCEQQHFCHCQSSLSTKWEQTGVTIHDAWYIFNLTSLVHKWKLCFSDLMFFDMFDVQVWQLAGSNDLYWKLFCTYCSFCLKVTLMFLNRCCSAEFY